MKTLVIGGVFVALALGAPFVAADEDTEVADQFFKIGSSAYARGDNRAAARAFENAYEHAPRGASIFNAATAWDSAGDLAPAADDYALSLKALDLDAPQIERAKSRLAVLDTSLGRIEVTASAPGKLSVAHAMKPLPASVHLNPGAYVLRLTFDDGITANQNVTVIAGETKFISVQEPSRSSFPAPTATTAPSYVADHPAGRSHVLPVIGWIALGAGVVAATAGVVLGVEAVDSRDQWNASNLTDLAAHDRAITYRALTDVAWIGAATLAVSGAVLLIGGSSSRSPTAALVIGPSSVGWQTRF